MIKNFIIFSLQSIYSIFPGIMANMAPVIFKKINFLNYPLDFNKKLFNKPILGPNKTFRGFFAGILTSMIIISIQYLIFKFTIFKNLNIIDFDSVNFLLLGFLMGSGVMAGDTVKSFIKRRLGILSSKPFVPWDQIDGVIGGLLFSRIIWNYSLKYAVFIIILTFFIHIIIRHISYYLRFTENKW